MRNCLRITIAVSSLLLIGSATTAASAGAYDMVADVPFEFSVGETTLPRDTYRLSRAEGQTDVLRLSSLRRAVYVIAQRDRSTDNDETTQLVFHRYGDKYFLREIQFLGSVEFELPETRAERDAAERRVSRASSNKQVVVIAARLE